MNTGFAVIIKRITRYSFAYHLGLKKMLKKTAETYIKIGVLVIAHMKGE